MNSSGGSAALRAQRLARQWIHVLASVRGVFGRIAHNFYVDVDSNPEVFFLRSHAEWRSVLSRYFRCVEIGIFYARAVRGWKGA